MSGKYLTVVTVLRDSSHVIHQSTDTAPAHTACGSAGTWHYGGNSSATTCRRS